jgi:hypothetical protein
MKPTILLPRCNLALDQSPGLVPLSSILLNSSRSSDGPRNRSRNYKTASDNNFNLYKRLKAFEKQLQKSKDNLLKASQLADCTFLNSPERESDGIDYESTLTEDSSEQNSLFQPKNDDSVARYISEILLNEDNRPPSCSENVVIGKSHHGNADPEEAHHHRSSKVKAFCFLLSLLFFVCLVRYRQE